MLLLLHSSHIFVHTTEVTNLGDSYSTHLAANSFTINIFTITPSFPLDFYISLLRFGAREELNIIRYGCVLCYVQKCGFCLHLET